MALRTMRSALVTVLAALTLLTSISIAEATHTAPDLDATSYNSTVILSWTSVHDADTYWYTLVDANGDTKHGGDVSAIAVSIPDVAPGAYTAKVRAISNGSEGPWSEEVSVTVHGSESAVPGVPKIHGVPVVHQGYLRVHWYAAAEGPDPTGYVLAWYANGRWSYDSYEVSPSAADHHVGNGTVLVKLKACNDNGCSAWTDTVEAVHL